MMATTDVFSESVDEVAFAGKQCVAVNTGSAQTSPAPEPRPSRGGNLFVFALPDRREGRWRERLAVRACHAHRGTYNRRHQPSGGKP